MKFPDRICKICLEKCENFNAIHENTKNVFDILLPKIDFAVIQEPVMCKNCAEVLTNCFDFKVKCLHTHDYIILFVNKDNVKLDLRDVYLSKNETDIDFAEDEDVCGLCLGLVKKCSTISIDMEVGGVTLKKMIDQCLPQLDLSIINRPIICPPCRGSLKSCFHFVTNCLNVEERIKKYCETIDIKSKGQKELNSLSQIAIDVTASKLDTNSVDIKVGERSCEDRINPAGRTIGEGGDLIKLEQMGADEDVENKYENLMEFVDEKVNDNPQFAPNNICSAVESNKLGSIKIEGTFCEGKETKYNGENVVEMEDQKFLVNEKIEIKTDQHDFNRLVNNIVLPQSEVNIGLQRREERLMPNIEGNVSELNIKRALRNKRNVQRPSEINMYNCDLCSYRTENKYLLKSHTLTHKHPTEVTMYNCDSCSYQTKRKHGLKTHLLLHKDPSELTVYKCDSCSFRTKYKVSLTVHFQKHKDPSEVTMYKCDSCSYQTKRKHCLKSHLLLHKDPSEVTMYKCDFCAFQTKWKQDLKTHLSVHKDASEVPMYKCDTCSFQTKNKYYITSHSLVHKDPSEAAVYKCDSCSYVARFRDCLKTHLLVHKNPSEVTMYNCDSCSFQTKNKYYFTSHLLVHKDPSEVTMYKCDSCSFQTKRKHCLKGHLLTHKDPSEVIMYKCDSCSFQTKYKYQVNRHLLTHKKSRK